MKKLLTSLLALSVFLCGCELTQAPVKNTDLVTQTVNETDYPASAEVTVPVTTEEIVTEPVFEPALAVTARSYEKKAIDKVFGGEFDFTHKVEYPKIESDKPGAAELNKQIADYYDKIINELINGEEENYLYNIFYEASTDNLGVIFIRMIQSIGWQYSEGMVDQKIYYYDTVNDKVLTAEEYASMHNIDLERAKENVLYTYELASAYYEDKGVAVSEIGGEVLGAPDTGKLYPAKQTEFDFDFYGIEIDGDDLIMHYGGQMYTYSTYKFVLDRDTLAPRTPHYKGYVMPNGTSGDIVINLENGEVTNYNLPAETGIFAINITSSRITVHSTSLLSYSISVNGGECFSPGGQAYDPSTGEYLDEFYFNDYISPNDLKTIELIPR